MNMPINKKKRSLDEAVSNIAIKDDNPQQPDDKKSKIHADVQHQEENTKPLVVVAESTTVKKSLPLKNLSAKAQSSFKSPLLANRTNTSQQQQPAKPSVRAASTKTNEQLADEIQELEQRLNQIDKKIDDYESQGMVVEQLDGIINKLHVFNEIKDVAQLIMGKIAEFKQITIKQVHKEYDADLNDS